MCILPGAFEKGLVVAKRRPAHRLPSVDARPANAAAIMVECTNARPTLGDWLQGVERRFGGSSSGSRRRPVFDDNDRGEGPSDLGRMRRGTGVGGSNVR